MIRVLALAVAVLSSASLAVIVASAQTSGQITIETAQPKLGQKSPKVDQTVEGTIKSVRGTLVTLEDGTELSIPSSVRVDQLRPGAQISAQYEKRAGQKVATSVHIKG